MKVAALIGTNKKGESKCIACGTDISALKDEFKSIKGADRAGKKSEFARIDLIFSGANRGKKVRLNQVEEAEKKAPKKKSKKD